MKLRLLTFSLVLLFALPVTANAQTFSGAQGLGTSPPTDQPDNPLAPYPSAIAVAGLEGNITDLNVTLKNITTDGVFDYTRYLLIAPDGTGVRFWAGAGGGAINVTLVVDQQATSSFPTAGSPALGANGATVAYKPSIGTYAPYTSSEFPAPAVVPSDITPDLNRLNGHGANGNWRLYASHAYSYMGYNGVSISGGWSLDITTTGDITAPAFSRPAVSGRTVGFDLTEAASIQFRVDRIAKGVKVKQKCIAPKKGRKGKSCNRYLPLPGAIDTIGVAGINSFAWNGKIGTKKLAAGKYRLTGIAKDAAGNQSPPQTFTVTIKKPVKKKSKN